MKMKLFALPASSALGEAISKEIGEPLATWEERVFEDGESKLRPLEDVRGADAYVIQSLYGGPNDSPNDKLCRMLFFIGALRTNWAKRVTSVVPYLAYARKDRQTKPRDPLTSRYVAELFEAMGTHRVVSLEVHNIVAFQNAFRCEALALDTRGVLLDRASQLVSDQLACVASPDPGGVKRAQLFREALERKIGRSVGFAFIDKRRSAGLVSGSLVSGDVKQARVLIVDDMIASGGTMVRAAGALLEAGAQDAWAIAAHGLFTSGSEEALVDTNISGWITTDTVPQFRLSANQIERVTCVSAALHFADAIRRLHRDESVIELPASGS